MNKSTFSLLLSGVLFFSTFVTGQRVQAQGFSFPAEMNKSFTPLSIDPGGISRLRVSIYNPNAFNLADASWTDNLAGVQPGILLASPLNIENTCGGSVTAQPGGTVLSLSRGTVPAQVGSTPGSCTVSVDVTSSTPFNLINTIPAGALKSTGGGGRVSNTSPASATLHVGLIRGPSISKRFSPNTILVGQTSQMTIQIRNNNLTSALNQASITDSLPSGVILADPASSSLSGCGDSAFVTATGGSSSLALSGAVVAAGATCSIRVNVTSTTSGIYSNTIPAGALQTQQGITNESPASARLNVQDIGVAKAFVPSSFQAGKTSTLTITLRNPTRSTYTGVSLSDTLPGNVLTVVPDSATTTCGGTVSITPPRTVNLVNGSVPSGTPSSPGSCTISFQVTTPADASGGNYRNTIPEGALVTDQGITNGLPASAWVRVYQGGTGINASKSFSPSTIAAGENARLRINIPAPLGQIPY